MKAWKQNGCGICCRGKWDREGKTLTTFSESINFPYNDRPYRKYTYEKKNPLVIDYELSTIIFKYTTKQSELKYHWFFKKSVLKKKLLWWIQPAYCYQLKCHCKIHRSVVLLFTIQIYKEGIAVCHIFHIFFLLLRKWKKTLSSSCGFWPKLNPVLRQEHCRVLCPWAVGHVALHKHVFAITCGQKLQNDSTSTAIPLQQELPLFNNDDGKL